MVSLHDDLLDENTTHIMAKILQSTRNRIHFSELKEFVEDKNQFTQLLKENKILSNAGTFDYTTGWFEINPEIFEYNNTKTSRRELIQYILTRLAFIITTFSIGTYLLLADINQSLGTVIFFISLAAMMLILADFYGRFYKENEEHAKAGVASHLSDAFMRI